MDDIARSFIEQKEAQAREHLDLEKSNFLRTNKLMKKEYSPDGTYSQEYSIAEYGENGEPCAYYRIVPIEVTDEEYMQLKNAVKKAKPNSDVNPVAKILRIISYVILTFGFIYGIALGFDSHGGFETTILYWLGAFVSGMMFIGFAEIIQLLQDIKNK